MEQALSCRTHAPHGAPRLARDPARADAIGGASQGDPNRYIGREVGRRGPAQLLRRPNVGKRRSPSTSRRRRAGPRAAGWCASAGGRLLHQHAARPTTGLGHRLRELARGARRPHLVRHLAQGLDYPDVPGYDPVIRRSAVHGPDRRRRRSAAAVRAAHHRPQGRRRGLHPGPARAPRARRERPGALHRRLPAGGALSWLHTFLPCSTWEPPSELRARATSTASSSRSTPTPPATATSTWPSAGRAVATVRPAGDVPLLEPAALRHQRGAAPGQGRAAPADRGLTRQHPTAAVAEVLPRRPSPTAASPHRGRDGAPLRGSRALRTVTPTAAWCAPRRGLHPYLESVGGTLPFAPRYASTPTRSSGSWLAADEIATLHARGVLA